MTEANRAREERERFQERLRHAQKLESLGVLAGGIAHDFNNLLVGILGNADLALMRRGDARRVSRCSDREDGRGAADLTGQMLAYSGQGSSESGRVDRTRRPGDGAPARGVVSKRAVLTYELATDLPPVVADATQMPTGS